ncbi:MAG: transcriptional regulator [Anaerolineae bacterium]|nr:transcriptional regulator [Anaerolineae bacterium]
MTDFKQMLETDRLIHEPARLIIMALLYGVENADFTFLLRETGLTRGNLSFHLSKLEEGEYVAIEKTFKGKRPHTLCSLTDNGRTAFNTYRQQLQNAANSLPD